MFSLNRAVAFPALNRVEQHFEPAAVSCEERSWQAETGLRGADDSHHHEQMTRDRQRDSSHEQPAQASRRARRKGWIVPGDAQKAEFHGPVGEVSTDRTRRIPRGNNHRLEQCLAPRAQPQRFIIGHALRMQDAHAHQGPHHGEEPECARYRDQQSPPEDVPPLLVRPLVKQGRVKFFGIQGCFSVAAHDDRRPPESGSQEYEAFAWNTGVRHPGERPQFTIHEQASRRTARLLRGSNRCQEAEEGQDTGPSDSQKPNETWTEQATVILDAAFSREVHDNRMKHPERQQDNRSRKNEEHELDPHRHSRSASSRRASSTASGSSRVASARNAAIPAGPRAITSLARDCARRSAKAVRDMAAA